LILVLRKTHDIKVATNEAFILSLRLLQLIVSS
jgi:hypothetical protein